MTKVSQFFDHAKVTFLFSLLEIENHQHRPNSITPADPLAPTLTIFDRCPLILIPFHRDCSRTHNLLLYLLPLRLFINDQKLHL